MFSSLAHYDWLFAHAAAVLLSLTTYVVASIARRQRRHPSAAIGWVLALALMPYVALPLFLLFGVRKRVRAPRRRQTTRVIAPAADNSPAARLQALAVALGMSPPLQYRDLVIHEDGEHALDRLRELLRGARNTIEVSTFLIGNDVVGAEICGVLAHRAREGVRVRLIVDGVGRYLGGSPGLGPLKSAGVQLRLFAPPWSWLLLGGGANLRNHRKLVVADGDWVWAGGRNLAADYFLPVTNNSRGVAERWTDLTFDLHGSLAAQARRQFDEDWQMAAAKSSFDRDEAEVAAISTNHGPVGQFLPSGPDQSDDTVYALLVDACFNAQKRLLAATPYFVPDEVLLMAFVLAARRGVVVDLIVPHRSNHRLADLARPRALRELADAGARIWLAPQMLHAKLVVVDDTVAFTGSVNLDQRSLFLNYEAMFALYDAAAIDDFVRWADRVRSTASLMKPAPVSVAREFGEGLLRWLTFQL